MPSEERHVPRRPHGPGGRVVEKPKNFKLALKKFFKYLKPYLPAIIVAVVLAIASSVLAIVGPNKLSELTDLIKGGIAYNISGEVTSVSINLNAIYKIAITLLIIYICSAIFSYVEHFIMATYSNKFAKTLRTNISKKINTIPLSYMDTHTCGDILSRVTNDIDTVGMSLSQTVGTLFGAGALMIGSLIMMFVTNWIMAFTAIASSLIGFIFMFIILIKSQKYFVRRQNELGAVNGHVEEIYSSHNVVKAYNAEASATAEFDTLNNKLYKSNKMSEFLSSLMPPIMTFIGNLGYVAVCVVGAVLVLNNLASIGTIVAFILYVRLFSNPLSQIAQCMNNVQSGMAASERVFEFLEEPDMSSEESCTGYVNPAKAKGEIEFKHVKFGYDNSRTIINDFSCKVKPGQKIAIVGPTGAGKTTLVNLLMKFYDIDAGEIIIDGEPISNLKRDNIHNLFTMVLQDTWLFNGTVRENLCYNRTGITDEQIMEVCRVIGIEKFVLSLPNGLNTILDDNQSISAGQKQLITIARGMLEDAPFLILDEATSSVDTRTEELVQKAMDKLTENRTSFIIAHRLSTIKNADRILVLDKGDVIEQGTHKQLMELGGTYAELYNSQFKK